MAESDKIKSVLSLVVRLQNLCEGFDETNKSAVLTSKIKILLELSKRQFVSPNVLSEKLGLAKSNITLYCNALVKDELIRKKKDEIDSREISFYITSKGREELNLYLSKAKKNFERQIQLLNKAKNFHFKKLCKLFTSKNWSICNRFF